MLNKKIAIITLAAVISNFSFTTTNVLADEITKNVKIVAQTKNNQNLKTKKSNKSKNESKLSESNQMSLTQKEHSHLPKMVTYHGKQEMI